MQNIFVYNIFGCMPVVSPHNCRGTGKFQNCLNNLNILSFDLSALPRSNLEFSLILGTHWIRVDNLRKNKFHVKYNVKIRVYIK